MKKLFDDDEEEHFGMEKSRILVTVIPFVLIIVILAVTLIVNHVKKAGDETEDLQQSIMDYADENKGAEDGAGDADTVMSANVSFAETEEHREGEESEPEEEPKEDGEPEEEKKPAATAKKESPTAAPMASPTPYRGETMKAGKTGYSKVEFHEEEQLRDMMAYWADNNQKAINDLVYLDHYVAMSYSLRGTNNFYYYGDKDGNGRPNGKGIAVYADNRYYYGDWKNGVRSGQGTFWHFHIHFEKNTDDLYTAHQYTGGWANDLPDGEGSEHYDYDGMLLKERVGYNANLIGSYSAGLINGDFYMTNIYSDESSKEWNGKAERGSWVYLSKNRDKKGNGPVLVEVNNPDNYIWMHPNNNKNIGVPCLTIQKD
ncbi:MAG: hypothetical protein NC400_08825 [Clostridium sp.]|nr:hypothetical protein [Clostridium sp.]